MKKKSPLVTVVMPTFKSQHFDQALKSALGQTYKNIEICVSDNCPTQAIYEICQRYPNITYTKCEAIGAVDNFFSAIRMGQGKYIKPLFDDDILHPFCIERFVEVLDENEDVSLVFSASCTINELNKRINRRRPFGRNSKISGLEMRKIFLAKFFNFVGEFSTTMFRRESLNKFPDFKLYEIFGETFHKGLADVVGYWNLTEGNFSFYLDEELSYFRVGESHNSNSNIKNANYKYAVLDWMTLLFLAYKFQDINENEFKASRTAVFELHERWAPIYFELNSMLEQYNDEFLKLESVIPLYIKWKNKITKWIHPK